MDYPPGNRPPPMHHQPPPKSSMHHSQHPLLSNQLQPINSDSHTTMWLDDPYAISTGVPSQRDSGFNSRPASLRSNDSTVTNNTVQTLHPCELENNHPQFVEMQPPPQQPRPDPAQVIPELLNLLAEDDPVIVREAVLLTHMLIKEGGESRAEVIANREVITALLNTFSKDVGDGKVTNVLANLFHAVSQQQEGLRAILEAGGIPRLVEILGSSDNTVNYIITTLHNFLIVLQAQAAAELDRCNGISKFLSLLSRSSDKLHTLVSDCLLKMSIYNYNAKIFLQNSEECVQRLLYIMDTSKYDKLLLTISKLFPIISSGSETIKRAFVKSKGLHIFEKHLRTTKSIRIRHNLLVALRNVSDQATRLEDVDSLIQLLVGYLITEDHQSVLCSLGILSNLTADNRTNKSLLVKLNGVTTLMQKILMNADNNDDLIEVALCTLRHVTARHDLEVEARETVRKSYGLGNFVKLFRDKNLKDHWKTIKATVGLIKNLALSSNIIPLLCEQNAGRRLVELLLAVDRERSKVGDENSQYHHQFDAMLDVIIGALANLAKDQSCRAMIKEIDCVSIFVRFSHLPACPLQQSSMVILKELNIDRNQTNDSSYSTSAYNNMADSRHHRQ